MVATVIALFKVAHAGSPPGRRSVCAPARGADAFELGERSWRRVRFARRRADDALPQLERRRGRCRDGSNSLALRVSGTCESVTVGLAVAASRTPDVWSRQARPGTCGPCVALAVRMNGRERVTQAGRFGQPGAMLRTAQIDPPGHLMRYAEGLVISATPVL